MKRDWSHIHAHFVGIGGSGMSGIARIMVARGARVSGSDLHDSPSLNGLRALGIEVFVGHNAAQIGGESRRNTGAGESAGSRGVNGG